MSDHKGARILLDVLPFASSLLGDKGYDSNWFREALADRGIEPYIPPAKSRRQPIDYDKALYRQRHKVENLFGKLKDWRRIATDTTDAPAPSSPLSASQQPASSGSDQCVLSLVQRAYSGKPSNADFKITKTPDGPRNICQVIQGKAAGQ